MIDDRLWNRKRIAMVEELEKLAEESPILEIASIEHRVDEVRAVLALEIPTMVTPMNSEVRLDGPVVVGIRFTQRFCTVPPLPWEIVTVLHPLDVYHPNIDSRGSGALCLGSPPAGISLAEIVHLTYAALTLASFSPQEWRGLHAAASRFTREHAEQFPIIETGLLESPPEGFHRPFAPVAADVAARIAARIARMEEAS